MPEWGWCLIPKPNVDGVSNDQRYPMCDSVASFQRRRSFESQASFKEGGHPLLKFRPSTASGVDESFWFGE